MYHFNASTYVKTFDEFKKYGFIGKDYILRLSLNIANLVCYSIIKTLKLFLFILFSF